MTSLDMLRERRGPDPALLPSALPSPAPGADGFTHAIAVLERIATALEEIADREKAI